MMLSVAIMLSFASSLISPNIQNKEYPHFEKNSSDSLITSLITYKICLTVHLTLHYMLPDYIGDIIQPNTTKYSQRPLNKFKLQTKVLINLSSPQLKAFSIHAPLTWISSPLPYVLFHRLLFSTTFISTTLENYHPHS